MRKDMLESADLESPEEGERKKAVQITGGRQVSDYAGAFNRGTEATAVGKIGGDGKVDVEATLKTRQFRDRIYSAAGEGDAVLDLGAGEDVGELSGEGMESIVALDQEVKRVQGKELEYTGLTGQAADKLQRTFGGSRKRVFSKRTSGEVLKQAA